MILQCTKCKQDSQGFHVARCSQGSQNQRVKKGQCVNKKEQKSKGERIGWLCKVLSCLRNEFVHLAAICPGVSYLLPFLVLALGVVCFLLFSLLAFWLSDCVSVIGLLLYICMALLQMTSLSASFTTIGFATFSFATFGFATLGF